MQSSTSVPISSASTQPPPPAPTRPGSAAMNPNAAAVPQPPMWACPMCTFDNPALHLQCGMCQTQRPTAPSAASAVHAPPSSSSRRPGAPADSMDSCLRAFASRVSEPTYAEVTGLLTRLLDKVIKNPQEAKFRKIALTFPLIQNTLGALPCRVENAFLYACLHLYHERRVCMCVCARFSSASCRITFA